MDQIKIVLNGTNPKKTIEGMHSIVFDVVKELTALQDRDLIITDIELVVHAEEGVGLQEYEQYNVDDMTIIVDKTLIKKLIKEMGNKNNEDT